MDHKTRSSYMLYMKMATNIKSTLNGESKWTERYVIEIIRIETLEKLYQCWIKLISRQRTLP